MNCNLPYLYHYTTLNSLEAILKNKTIRLNSLANMNDLQEKQTADAKDIGRFIFVSSWTEEATESIPMWKMYASMDAGIRIALPPNPFRRKGTSLKELAKVLKSHAIIERDKDSVDTLFDFCDLVKRQCITPEGVSGDILKKVEYIDDESLLIPHIVEEDEKGLSIHFGRLGCYKSSYWSFEKEWRYRVTFAPFHYDANPALMLLVFCLNAQLFKRGMGELSFDYYDLELDEKALKQMIITPSPQLTADNRRKIENLVSLYNPDAVIQESALSGLVKI